MDDTTPEENTPAITADSLRNEIAGTRAQEEQFMQAVFMARGARLMAEHLLKLLEK